MIGDVGLWEWSAGKNETCKKLNWLELGLNFWAGSFNRCLMGV